MARAKWLDWGSNQNMLTNPTATKKLPEITNTQMNREDKKINYVSLVRWQQLGSLVVDTFVEKYEQTFTAFYQMWQPKHLYTGRQYFRCIDGIKRFTQKQNTQITLFLIKSYIWLICISVSNWHNASEISQDTRWSYSPGNKANKIQLYKKKKLQQIKIKDGQVKNATMLIKTPPSWVLEKRQTPNLCFSSLLPFKLTVCTEHTF